MENFFKIVAGVALIGIFAGIAVAIDGIGSSQVSLGLGIATIPWCVRLACLQEVR